MNALYPESTKCAGSKDYPYAAPGYRSSRLKDLKITGWLCESVFVFLAEHLQVGHQLNILNRVNVHWYMNLNSGLFVPNCRKGRHLGSPSTYTSL